MRLREQLDLDSMDFLDIVMELRKRYNVEVPEADYMQLASLSSSVAWFTSKVPTVWSNSCWEMSLSRSSCCARS